MTETQQQVWLSQPAYERLKEELGELLRRRSGLLGDGAGAEADDDTAQVDDGQALVDRRERDLRIRKLQEMLRDPIVGHDPPDDGVAEPGMVVTVRYMDGTETESFLLADRAGNVVLDVETCSPDSPLGKALLGAREGEQREFLLPDGQLMAVTLVRAVPYARRTG